MQEQQAAGEIRDKGPVGARGAPLPKVVGPVRRLLVLKRQMRRRRAMRQCNVQQQEVDANHQ